MKNSKSLKNESIDPENLKSPGLSLEKCIGNAVKELRLRQRLTISQVADLADLSVGMLSKIENGQISAGLDTLSRLAKALGSTMAMLFRSYDVPVGGAQLVKKQPLFCAMVSGLDILSSRFHSTRDQQNHSMLF